jgi:nucleoside-diphosphate-sugar epimerase
MVRDKRIVLTGGAGFIGTALCERLVANNKIVVVDNERRNAMKHTELAAHPNVTYRKVDVLDAPALRETFVAADIIIHLAAVAGVTDVFDHPVETMKVNLIGTYNVLEAAHSVGGVKCLVDFSTSEVFGSYAYRVQEGDVTSLGAVGEVRWTYAVSKLATEHLAYNYYREYGLPTVSIRPFNIYGPRQVGVGAIHTFIVRALKGEDLQLHNGGDQIRSWCFIDDIVDGVVLAISKPEAIGHAFNIGNPRSTVTTHQLAREIVRLSGSRSKLVDVVYDRTDVELRIPSIKKAKELLGYAPHVDLEEGLLKTIEWYRANANV